MSTRDHAPQAGIPDDRLTGFRKAGNKRRLRVDQGQTGFFEGREFRTFKELNIPGSAGTKLVVKVVVPLNIIFHAASFEVDSGALRVSTVAGGTEGGTFNDPLPIIPKNRMTEVPTYEDTGLPYAAQVTLAAGGTLTGGTLTGGTVLDVVRLVTSAGGQSQNVEAVGNGDDAERGIAPGTYYFVFELLTGTTVTGTFHAHWEERPA